MCLNGNKGVKKKAPGWDKKLKSLFSYRVKNRVRAQPPPPPRGREPRAPAQRAPAALFLEAADPCPTPLACGLGGSGAPFGASAPPVKLLMYV